MANKNYNNVDEYLKDTTGKDSSGMNAQQLQNAESDLSAYRQKNMLQQTYDSAIGELDAQKKAQEKQAYFNNAKLMKYMPQNLKAQGLNGLGVSQTAQIEANNNYMNQLANITSDYNKNKSTLSNDLAKNQLAVDESIRQEKNSLNQYWQNRQDAIDAEQRGYDYQDKVRGEEREYQDKVRNEDYAYQDKVRNEGYTHDITMQDKANEFTASENEKDRAFTSSENEKDRAFTSSENDKKYAHDSTMQEDSQQFSAEQNQLNRDFEASESEKKYDHDEKMQNDAQQFTTDQIEAEGVANHSSNLLSYRTSQLSQYASQFETDEKGNYSKEDLLKIKEYVENNNLKEGLSAYDQALLDEQLKEFQTKEDNITIDKSNSNKFTSSVGYNYEVVPGAIDDVIESEWAKRIAKEQLIEKFGTKSKIPNGYEISKFGNTNDGREVVYVYYNGQIQLAYKDI